MVAVSLKKKCNVIALGDQLGALCPPRGGDREGAREMQEGGDLGIYVYV